MFEKFKNKTKREKKEAAMTAGKVTLGLVGVGALSFILGKTIGFKDGIDTFLEFGLKYDKNKEDSKEIEEIEEEGEA